MTMNHDIHRAAAIYSNPSERDPAKFRKPPTNFNFIPDRLEPMYAMEDRPRYACAWPYDTDHGRMCCGRKTVLRKSYCETHIKRSRPDDYDVLIKKRVK